VVVRVEQRARKRAAALGTYRLPVRNYLDRIAHACAGASVRIGDGENDVASIAVARPAI
jgi:hypothetical protein